MAMRKSAVPAAVPAFAAPMSEGGRSKGRAGEGRVRIIGGAWRSRILRFPAVQDLRPTSDRVRETLFNWLGQDLTGKTCLDLFAGSGALGFEALSRNAKLVVMVESVATVRASLSLNAASLDAGARLKIAAGDALQFLRTCEDRFDVIFCDPPFREDWFARLWPLLGKLLSDGGVVYAESGRTLELPPGWQALKAGKAGQAAYQLLGRQSLQQSEAHHG
jgi:16S rRNA (guanine966-N2)-methyltransferase